MLGIKILPGLSLPMYPMRPTRGRAIRDQHELTCLHTDVNSGLWHVQPKLNGDRACLGKVNGAIHICNRHGSWLKHPVTNLTLFKAMPDHTLLDGEVFQSCFFPFEALALDGCLLLRQCPSQRAETAKQICASLGVQWLFKPHVPLWFKNHETTEQWEGFVLKRIGSPYIQLGSAGQESSSWVKRRWA